jgi:hypothetical protein
VEEQLPKGSTRLSTTSGRNYEIDTYRTPIPVGDIAAQLQNTKLSAPTSEGPFSLLFTFSGDAACDGTYQVAVQWTADAPRTAQLRGNCED